MLDASRTTLLCPRNDLESATILDLAKELGCQVLEVAGNWGTNLQDALTQHPDPSTFRPNVVIVELPGSTEAITAAGRRVHVVDHHLSTAGGTLARQSSLEQFAALFDHDLTQAQMEVAIADRDFFPGLSAAGVAADRAFALREEEYALRREADLLADAKKLADAQAFRTLGNLKLIKAPPRLADVMLEAAQTPEKSAYEQAALANEPVTLPRVLVLLEEEGRISGVRFAGKASERAALIVLLEDPKLAAELEIWTGGNSHGCFFGAAAPTGHPGAPFETLISRLLALIAGTDHPTIGYHCTLLLPLDLYTDDELSKNPACQPARIRQSLGTQVSAGAIEPHRLQPVSPGDLQGNQNEAALETQARLYFLPQLQSLVTDSQLDGEYEDRPLKPILRWRLPHKFVKSLRWKLLGRGPRTITARITDCSLYGYHNGLYIFAIELKQALSARSLPWAEQLCDPADGWWQPLFDADASQFPELEQLRLDHWLRFTQQARILFPSFVEQAFEDEIDIQELHGGEQSPKRFVHSDDLSPIIRHLLQKFLPDTESSGTGISLTRQLCRQHLKEERMFVNCAYALAGPAPADAAAKEQAHRLFSLALYVDVEAGTYDAARGYAYDRDFVASLMDDPDTGQSLNRWRDIGTHMGFGPYANAYLGYGSFFSKVILPEHVPYPYQRMLILALFYVLTLRNFNRRIAHASKHLVDNRGGDPGIHFRHLRQRFIEFTNNYWFREVTPTIQGGEIFARQTRALGLEDEYELIKDEMERADEYVQSVRDRIMNERVAAAGWIAALLAIASLAFGAIGSDHWGLILFFTLIVSGVSYGIYLWLGPGDLSPLQRLRRWCRRRQEIDETE